MADWKHTGQYVSETWGPGDEGLLQSLNPLQEASYNACSSQTKFSQDAVRVTLKLESSLGVSLRSSGQTFNAAETEILTQGWFLSTPRCSSARPSAGVMVPKPKHRLLCRCRRLSCYRWNVLNRREKQALHNFNLRLCPTVYSQVSLLTVRHNL
jgi:hypothetical protein